MSVPYTKGVTGIMIALMFLLPYHSYAQTTWQPRTNAELIAFLYGVVAQLQTQLEALRDGSGSYDDSDNNDDGYDDTDDDTPSSGRPQVAALEVDDITANSASVTVEVDMRSYGYGTVFLVYGTSESKIQAVTRERNYDDIEFESSVTGYIINTSYAGQGEIQTGLYGLQPATEYHYRACVEYIDDGSRNDDTKLTCDSVDSFTTKRR